MNANEKVLALVKAFPGAANNAIPAGAENEAANKLADELVALGGEAIVALLNLLVEQESSTAEDAKARFLLHAAVVRVGNPGKAIVKRELAAALAATLADARPKDVLLYVIRELQWIAGSENAPALGKLLADETLREDAARALVNIGGESAAAEFRAALGKASGLARLSLIQNLGVLRDAKSAADLKLAATDADASIREAAIWALANIGEPSAAEIALNAASADSPERAKHTRSCLLLAERLAAAGKKKAARNIYEHLRTTRTDDSDAYVREAAARGLVAIGG